MVSSTHAGRVAPPTIATRSRRLVFGVAIAGFALFGLIVTAGARGNPAIGWMMMFAPGDFVAPGALGAFLEGLQAPIPPWLAALEVLAQRRFGSAELVTVGLYRFCMVGGYAIALALAWPSLVRLAVALALSVLFLWATVLIHPASPIVYDVVLPFLLIAYFAALRAGAALGGEAGAIALLLAGGFCLALAEMTRPFMILFLPALVLAAWFVLRARPRRRFAALVAPVVLIAGAWHAHQFLNHGQIAWSNHAGFNLIRAWRMVPYPELAPEPGSRPVALQRLPNLNTKEHGENSRRLRRAVLDYVLAHPGRSALHALERVAIFVGAGHQIEDHAPDHRILPLYDVVLRYANILALAGALAIAVAMLAAPGRAGAMLGSVDNQILGFVALAMVLIAVTESGEEARFQLSLLPLLAAVPVPLLLARDGARRRLRGRDRRRVALGAVLLVATIEILIWGSTRRPMPAAEGGPVEGGPVDAASSTAGNGDARMLRVAQFNVRGGAWQDRAGELAANAACLRDIDLAGIAELRGGGPFGLGETQGALLARAAGLAAIEAPAEWRWWSPQFGNALLTRVPVARWTRRALPHKAGVSYRALLAADLAIGGRTVRVLVTQVDNHDHAIQIAAIDRAFRAAPSPAILLADFGTAEPRLEPLKRLVGDPQFLVATNDPPFPAAQVQGGYVIAKGFRRLAQSFCKGGVSMQPRLAVDLEFAP